MNSRFLFTGYSLPIIKMAYVFEIVSETAFYLMGRKIGGTPSPGPFLKTRSDMGHTPLIKYPLNIHHYIYVIDIIDIFMNELMGRLMGSLVIYRVD